MQKLDSHLQARHSTGMTGDSLQDFMNLPDSVDLTDALGEIYLYHEFLTQEQAAELCAVAGQHLPEAQQYNAEFDLKDEVTSQLTAVRALRSKVIDSSGRPRPDVSSREMKEVVAASNSLLQMLMKTHEKVLSYDRQRAIEKATISTIKTLPEEAQSRFFEQLEKELEMIE